jgi:uridine phosphorylase
MSESFPGIMKLNPAEVAPLTLVMGDPNRAKQTADLLDEPRLITNPREFHTYVGSWKGVKVTVSSHGVGAGGASMCFEELIQAGVHTIIRAGTCGSFQPEYREGSLIIASGAVRNDGVSDKLIPMEYPAVADYRLVTALIEATQARGIPYGLGICLSDAMFYPGLLESQHAMWAKAGVLAVEMEVATLFTIAGIRGARAGAILNVDNYIFERITYEPNREVVLQGTARMLEIALDALVSLQ